MGSSGGHRKLPGGSDDFRDTQRNRHCVIIYISPSYDHLAAGAHLDGQPQLPQLVDDRPLHLVSGRPLLELDILR